MSFYNKNFNNDNILVDTKPKLVDRKILKKIKKKKMSLAKEIKSNNYTEKVKNHCISFFKDNYGIIIIFSLLIFLLYFRYQDVKEKRKRQNLNQ